eukprot:SAG11_NODE_1756_length_4309_cov_2.250594_1_plen_709_part_00
MEGSEDCCRLVAPRGATALTVQQNCTMLPVYTCFQNPEGKIKSVADVGPDPGACCKACNELKGCMSWTHSPGGSGSCNLYSNVGPTKSNDKDGCSAGTIGGHGRPMPPMPPAPPHTPRGNKPNILFLVVESTDGRTWSPGYSNDAVKLPNFRKLQDGGVNFRRHYANAPVCCPSRATFWSGRHASNLAHQHSGYPNVTVPGALNNFEGLPDGYNLRIDQVLENQTDYNVKVSGKTDWNTGGHSENVRLDAWTMYAAWPYDISAMGGWNEETGCSHDHGSIREGGELGPDNKPNRSAHAGDWSTAVTTTDWIAEVSKDKATPWFAFQGMNIVHPPYTTNQYWYDQVDQSKVEVPAWEPLEEMHPCDLQSSMLKGCTPVQNKSDPNDFYAPVQRKLIRSIYLAMVAEFDAMVGYYMDAVKAAGVWEQTVLIVTSDHGDMQMEHQQFYKMVPYDASASVPMIMYDARPGKQFPKGNPKQVYDPTQLIDIFPTILTLAEVPKPLWPPTLDGESLLPFMDNSAATAAAPHHTKDGAPPGGRPNFVVSQFHGDNIAMSWFLVVKDGVAKPTRPGQAVGAAGTSTFKLIIWGTGNEVPALLFDLIADPMENDNLISSAAGRTRYAAIVADLEKDIRSVVDYPTMARSVAVYGKAMLHEWVGNNPDWKSKLAAKSLRWSESWNYDAAASESAFEEFLAAPPKVIGCRNATVWPPKQ